VGRVGPDPGLLAGEERALCPAASIAMARSAIDTCSPVASSMSISRSGGVGVIFCASRISPSVVFPMAETTTTTPWPALAVPMTRRATPRIFAASATEEPPYF
jgi:hypothetical protein